MISHCQVTASNWELHTVCICHIEYEESELITIKKHQKCNCCRHQHSALSAVLYLLYAKLEEEHGLARHAMAIYDRATLGVLPTEQNEVSVEQTGWVSGNPSVLRDNGIKMKTTYINIYIYISLFYFIFWSGLSAPLWHDSLCRICGTSSRLVKDGGQGFEDFCFLFTIL